MWRKKSVSELSLTCLRTSSMNVPSSCIHIYQLKPNLGSSPHPVRDSRWRGPLLRRRQLSKFNGRNLNRSWQNVSSENVLFSTLIWRSSPEHDHMTTDNEIPRDPLEHRLSLQRAGGDTTRLWLIKEDLLQHHETIRPNNSVSRVLNHRCLPPVYSLLLN